MSTKQFNIAVFGELQSYHEHIDHRKIHADMWIFAGGVSARSHKYQMENFFNWFMDIDTKYRIFIPSFRDTDLQDMPRYVAPMLDKFRSNPNNHYIENSGCTIEGIKIWGCSYHEPVEEDLCTKAYEIQDESIMESIYNQIPLCDILVTSQPPYNIFDTYYDQYKCKNICNGSEQLLYKVLDIKPKYHIFSSPKVKQDRKVEKNISFINSTIKHDFMMGVHQPLVIEYNL